MVAPYAWSSRNSIERCPSQFCCSLRHLPYWTLDKPGEAASTQILKPAYGVSDNAPRIILFLAHLAQSETTSAYLPALKTISGIPLISVPDPQDETHAKLSVIAPGWSLEHVDSLHRPDLSAKRSALTGLEIRQSTLAGRGQLCFSVQHTYIAATPEHALSFLVLCQPIGGVGSEAIQNLPMLATPRPNSSKSMGAGWFR